MIARGVQANKQDLEEKQRFPPCNAEWSSARGSRLWCSPKRYVASSCSSCPAPTSHRLVTLSALLSEAMS